jgi:sigma-B regulation protein RsbU (phosphoserine phosphatase)
MSNSYSHQLFSSHTIPFSHGSGAADGTEAALMSAIITDLAEWASCSWAAAMSSAGGSLVPICTCGAQFDVQACLDYTATVLRQECAIVGTAHLVIPIVVAEHIRGALAFGPKKNASPYTAADRKLMLEVAALIANLMRSERLACFVAANVDRLHRMRLDLTRAHDVQSRFYPCRLPRIQGLDYYGECRLAGDVGGDFFDFVPIGKQALVASIGDISGTGISAAILMSGVQSILRGLTADGHGNISTIVQELNRAVYEISPDIFFPTLFYTRIDPLLRRLQYVSAGHETALLVRKDAARVQRLERTGTVLGLTNHTAYAQRTLMLDPGDVLIAFTDGIAEVVDAKGCQSCEANIIEAVRSHPGAGASEVVGLVVDAVERFTGESGQVDDRTVIAVRYAGMAEKAWVEGGVAEAMFAAA